MNTPAKLLLVEDNEDNREMLARRLERKGYLVDIAGDGQQGLHAISNSRPDVLLLDLHLPVLTGWDVATILKRDPATATIPVIAVTADSSRGGREHAIASGCDAYDTKPIELPRLLNLIDIAINQGQLGLRCHTYKQISANPEKQSLQGTPSELIQKAIMAITSGFCHDFGNDLNVMRMLLEEDQSSVVKPSLDRIIARAQGAVTDLHQFVRNPSKEGADITIQLSQDEIADTLREYTVNYGDSIHIELRLDNLPNGASIPGLLMRHLLAPLINNGCESMKGSGCLTVSVSYFDLEQDLSIIVEDAGTGWNPSAEAISKAIRTGKPISSKGSNRGRGLRNIWRIVSKLGGKMTLAPSASGGARVELLLPKGVLYVGKAN